MVDWRMFFRRRTWPQAAFFSRGFRPFFFGAGAWGALAILSWVALLAAGMALPTYLNGRDWHVHAMLFGYLPAAMAGFLLTAVPNWTGRLPLSGAPLAALFALWLAGRIIMMFSAVAPWPAAFIDMAFLLMLAGIIWREILTGGNRRNVPVALLVSALAVANVLFHLTRLGAIGLDPRAPERPGLAVAALLLMLIGGRVTPSFTRNWLMKRGVREEARLPAPFGPLDKAAALIALAALAGWVAWPDAGGTAGLLAVAGVIHAVRLFRWKGWTTFREPLVTILHAGYGWLPMWMLLQAWAIVGGMSASDALHALTAGAVVTMTLAVMTRASLGHSGRKLTANKVTTMIYWLAIIGALLRINAGGDDILIHISGTLTAAALGLFAISYAPVFFGPRGGRPAG